MLSNTLNSKHCIVLSLFTKYSNTNKCLQLHFFFFLLAASLFSSLAMTWSAKALKGRDLLPYRNTELNYVGMVGTDKFVI